MNDFEEYLKQHNLYKFKENETQTEKVTRRHMKVGVNTRKLGIMKDRDTFIDPRMFEGDGVK